MKKEVNNKFNLVFCFLIYIILSIYNNFISQPPFFALPLFVLEYYKIGKKGQAAIEFLTTYGWAILVIIISVVALVNLGVFRPPTQPNSCSVSAPFACADIRILDSPASTNSNMVSNITIVANNVISLSISNFISNAGTCTGVDFSRTPFNGNGQMQIALLCPEGNRGDKEIGQFDLNYNVAGGINTHTTTLRYSATRERGETQQQGPDTTPPLRSNGQPTGTLPIGTTQTTISLSTDETATCKYSLTPGITYNLMTNTFTTTGSISHSQLITGLTNGQSYTYYVKCQDTSGNANTDDFIISFNVGTDTTPPTVSVTHSPTNPDNTQQVTYTATASDNVALSRVEIRIYVNNVPLYTQTCTNSPCTYTAGPYNAGDVIKYNATAIDTSNNVANSPSPSGTYSYTVSSGGQQYPMWITAYYAGWMSSYLPPSAIDYNAVTHIIHFALWPQSNGGLDCAGNTVCPGPTTTALINNAHAAGKKVLIGVGGWASDSNFRSATAGSCTTSGTGNTCYTFINNLVNFMQTNGYDGIDIDWEPMGSGDATRFTNFITALRARLNTINPRPLLTAATAWEFPLFSQLQNNFDQINIMTYDMSGPYQGWVTWHNSPLYNGGYTFPSTNGPVPSVDNEVNSMISTGVSRNKIGIGVDFYGYEWRGGSTFYENGNAAGGAFEPKLCWQSTGNPSRPCGNGQAPTQSFNIAYYELANTYNIVEYDYSHPNYRWDDVAKVPYLSYNPSGNSNDKFITYDNERSATEKVNYIKTKGIGGLIIWELGGGYRATRPLGQRDLLLQAIKTAAFGGNDLTPPTFTQLSNNPLSPNNVQQVTFTASASDQNGIKTITIYVDGLSIGTCDFLTTCQITAGPYSLGPHNYYAIAVDNSPNMNSATSPTQSFTVVAQDTTPPTVTITSPTNGQVFTTNSIIVSGTASDVGSGVAQVNVRVNGGSWQTATGTTSWTRDVTLTPGSNLIEAQAIDGQNNPSTIQSVSVTYNSLVPPLLIYTDSLQSPWIDASWGATNNFAYTIAPYQGTRSIRSVLSAWGGFSLLHGNWGSEIDIDPNLYSSLQFAINKSSGGTDMRLVIAIEQYDSLGNVINSYTFDNGTMLTRGSWNLITIPMSQLNPNGFPIHRIELIEQQGVSRTIQIDEAKFLPA